MTKKILAVLLATALIGTIFSACSQSSNSNDHQLVTQTTTELAEDTTSFKLSYSQSDSLDPFESETLNNQILSDLVFDSLFTLDETYEVQPNIAVSYSYTDSTTLTVVIKNGIVFSNGKQLTAENVVSSFYSAKESPRWKNELKAIKSAGAIDSNQIKFTLSYPNPNAHNLLTFAIASAKRDKDNNPIGSGRYKYSQGGGSVKLKVNTKHPDFKPRFTEITLVNVPTSESIDNAVNIGNITYAYRDLSDGDNVRLQCNKKMVSLNNLVYLGLNCYKASIVSNVNIRRAISLAIDRDTLVKSSYQGYGKSAESVFNPSSKQGKTTKVFSATADTVAAKQAVAQSGVKQSDLKLTILTSDNQNRIAAAKLIKQQLEAVGFKVSINKEKSKDYKKDVKKRNFDIYIGETGVTDDTNLFSFFSKGGTTSYGIDQKKCETAKAYSNYMNGKKEIGDFMLKFSEEIPFVPVLYRQGMICYSKSLHGDMQGYVNNYFSNIEDWYCD